MSEHYKSVFNRYTDSIKTSHSLAEESIKKLSQLGLQANPVHFTLMFEWLNESDVFFHSEIEQALQTNRYDNATAEVLFINLIGQMLSNSIPVQEVESLLKGLQTSFDGWTVSCEQKQSTLKKEISDLTQLTLPDALKQSLTESIIPTVDALISETEQLKSDITKANQEVILLKKELERATSVSKIDALTNIANRNGFNEILNKAAKQASLDQSTFALILIDLDYFSDINDTYGYLIGDSVLRYTARLIGNEVGEKGSYARFEGQQFIIIIPNCGYDEAVQIADSIRHKIATRPLQIKLNKKTLQPSVSVGLSLYQIGESVDMLIDRTTFQLKQAKMGGRNRVCGNG